MLEEMFVDVDAESFKGIIFENIHTVKAISKETGELK